MRSRFIVTKIRRDFTHGRLQILIGLNLNFDCCITNPSHVVWLLLSSRNKTDDCRRKNLRVQLFKKIRYFDRRKWAPFRKLKVRARVKQFTRIFWVSRNLQFLKGRRKKAVNKRSHPEYDTEKQHIVDWSIYEYNTYSIVN